MKSDKMKQAKKEAVGAVTPATSNSESNPVDQDKAAGAIPNVADAPPSGNTPVPPDEAPVEPNSGNEEVGPVNQPANVPRVPITPASTSAPAYRFERDDKPMLSQKGNYPDRNDEPLDYWAWVKRAEQPASPWLADWENSLGRAGWVVLRKLTDGETEDLPWEEMNPAFPEDADLYCPKRRIYLSLLPSWMPEGADYAFQAIRAGYPGSLVIIHARNVVKHQFGPFVQNGVIGLLTPENAKRCRELQALVEFHGVLYAIDPKNDWWEPTKNTMAADIYREYRLHSLHYHEEEERRERARKQAEKKSAVIYEKLRMIASKKGIRA